MQGFLAKDGYGLTAHWMAVDVLWMQHMGRGKTIGLANQISQGGLNGSLDVPTYRDLLGDPTLRMHVVEPVPSTPQASSSGNGVTVSWSAAPGDGTNGGNDPVAGFQGYHVYRAASANGPFERVPTAGLEDGLSVDDPAGTTGDVYMVRAVVLEDTPSGTYLNASQGAFSAPVP